MKRARDPARAREPVRWFSALMEERLRRHDADRGKRGWIGADRDWLLSRATAELAELQYAISMLGVSGSLEDVASEAADAANFLMMIADQTRPMNSRSRGGRRK